jgi:methylglutaconyl-CoA hydratase
MHSILVSDAGPIRTITLNRPAARNALTPEMQRELIKALDETAATRSVRVLVLTGAGEAFCAGLDLAALKNMADVQVASSEPAFELADDAHRISRILRILHEFPIPTIAAVNGHAVAGGTGIATVCDFTLAVPAAKFGYTEVKIGFVPALVSAFLSLQVGEKRARELFLTGQLFTAERAHQLGLVTELVELENLPERVLALAETLIANSPTSLRATKALLTDQHREWLDAAINMSLEASAASRMTPDFREGVTAFLEKRRPKWAE